jgi:mRNA interferase MazF
MKAGDIIRIPLQQSDGIVKPRPVLLLKKLPPFGDWLVCGITSKLRHEVKDFDILITDIHPDFTNTNLPKPFLIRLGFIGRVQEEKIEGVVGNISDTTYLQLIKNLTVFLNRA